ncbi:hypothetical protein LAZ67_21000289, partial [Cordylochernes scorpioides]
MPGHRKRRQFKQTDAFTRGMVIGLKRAGRSIRQIAADTHLGASTVHRLWRKWLEQGNVAIYRNAGATRETSVRVDRRILRQAVAAPQATCTAILQHVQDTLDHSISTRTISRRLVANGLHLCRPLRRLPLTPPNRRQRLEWCRARSTWMTEWHRVVFSDESRFCLSSDSRRVRVWRRRGERSNPAAIVERPTVRQRGIMVWGAIAYDSRSPLLRIQGTMTAQRYVDDVLRLVSFPYLQGVPNALYQQDNARPHTARIRQQALQDVQMLPWPPYSPDLSPIEHVWDIIGRRLHALPQPRSEDELWQMVEREWRAIPQDAIRTLIDSLPRRVAACIAVRGCRNSLDVANSLRGWRHEPKTSFRVVQPFKEGREETADNERSGRPSTSTTPEKVDKVLELVREDRRITVREVAEEAGISFGSTQSIMKDILGVRRLNAVLVPKDLTFDQKNARKETASLNLEATTDDPELLKRVITGDETWIYGFDSETTQQESEWRFKNEPRPKKARKAPSKVKRMPGHRKRRQFKQTDAFTRGMVIGLKRAGRSIRQIAADTHLGASTVHRLWRKWLEQGNVAIYRNAGATRETSVRVDRRILRQAVAAPQATCTAILQHVQDTLDHSISTRTISRRLVANGLHLCRPLRRLPLTPPNRRQRLEWCRARSTWMTEWHRVVFSDESRFCLSSDSRRVRVWRRRGERSNPAAIVERPTVRQRGIMVWGAIAYDSRSPLLRIQGTMTAQRYVDDVLRLVSFPYLQGVPNALYQQDNARPHTARIRQQALQDVQMLPWPPYSPDLSPIEHVWDIIGRRLHALPQPRSEDELWQMVEREWRAIPQDAIRTLIDSLPRRVAACIAVRGCRNSLDVANSLRGWRHEPKTSFRVVQPFKEGREETADNERSGRPSTSTTPEKVDKVLELVREDRRITVREVAEEAGISFGSTQSIMKDILGVRRLNAVLVPKDLTFDQKNARKETASLNLEATTDDPELLKRVITGDETWIYGFDSETTQQESEWRFKNEPRPKKARKAPSKVKRMPGHRKRRQFKQTDAFTRGMVIGLKRAGRSIRQIAADTHLGASTVHRLWRKWLEQGNVAIYRNAGATRETSVRVDRRILRQAVAAPQATCTAILQHVQDTLDHSISTRTISRRLVANGLHLCRPLRRLPLTPPNRRQRLEWCRARSTWMTEWHRVVFSDESRFCLSSDSRRVRVWRRRGERSNPAAIVERPTVRQRGIMVWGAIAYDSRSPLLRIQGTMTAQRYVDDVLRLVSFPYLQGVPNALYQQDNARPHTARIRQQALQDVQMLPWPPYSPDLSPIEHVWDIIGRRLHALPQPRSEDELWQMVEREWRAIPQDAIRTLIDSLPRRVAACIAVR